MVPIVRKSLLHLFFSVAFAATSQQNENWQRDAATGCQFSLIPQELLDGLRMPTLSWCGRCENGRAQGNGSVTLMEAGAVVLSMEFEGVNGQTVVDGRAVPAEDILRNAVTFSLKQCSQLNRIVRGDAKQ
jgi:hypothetical protein